MTTVKDIAKAVGVSIGTVDRIIHERGRYSEETAKKVRKVMKDLNYTPNIHARGLKKAKQHIFAVILPLKDQDGGYWELVEKGVLRASTELSSSYGCIVNIFHYNRFLSKSCITAINNAIDSKCDGLLIAPFKADEISKTLKQTTIPYIFIDSDIPELKNKKSFIGQDSHQSGILSGKLMSLLLHNAIANRPLLVVDPPESNYHLKSRIDGFCEFMNEKLPEIEIVKIKEEVDSEIKTHALLENYFNVKTNIPCGIFVANSSVYYVASYIEKNSKIVNNTPLIGYDIIPGKESVIEDGIIDFIITQQPEVQGYQGIIMLYESSVLNKKIKEKIITPLNIITKENLETFINNKTNE